MKRKILTIAAVAASVLTSVMAGAPAQAATTGALYNEGTLTSVLTGKSAGVIKSASLDHHTAKLGLATCITDIKPTAGLAGLTSLATYKVAGTSVAVYTYVCGTDVVGGKWW